MPISKDRAATYMAHFQHGRAMEKAWRDKLHAVLDDARDSTIQREVITHGINESEFRSAALERYALELTELMVIAERGEHVHKLDLELIQHRAAFHVAAGMTGHEAQIESWLTDRAGLPD